MKRVPALRACLMGLAMVAALAESGRPAPSAPSLVLSQNVFPDLEPGDEFTVFLEVVNPGSAEVISYDFFIRASADHAAWLIRQNLNAPVDAPLFSGVLPHPVTTTGTQDFGAESESTLNGFGIGVSHAQSLTFSVAPTLPVGTYTLLLGWNYQSGLAGPNLVDLHFEEFAMAEPLFVTFSVVPEPAGLVVLGILFAAFVGGWLATRGNLASFSLVLGDYIGLNIK